MKKLFLTIIMLLSLFFLYAEDDDYDYDYYVIGVGASFEKVTIDNLTVGFSWDSNASITISEICPVNNDVCKIMLYMSSSDTASGNTLAVYVRKKSAFAYMKRNGEIYAGIVSGFDYNKIEFFGKCENEGDE